MYALFKYQTNVRLGLVDEEKKSLSSLNDYFGYGFTCGKDINGDYKRDCIVESCEHDICFFKSKWDSIDFKTNFVVYQQFQCVKNTYVSKKEDETKEVNNWTRINVTSTFSAIQNLLHLCGKKCL